MLVALPRKRFKIHTSTLVRSENTTDLCGGPWESDHVHGTQFLGFVAVVVRIFTFHIERHNYDCYLVVIACFFLFLAKLFEHFSVVFYEHFYVDMVVVFIFD